MPSTDAPVADDHVWGSIDQQMRLQFELNDDGTYEYVELSFKGTWTFSDGKVTTDTGQTDGVFDGVTIWYVSQDGQSMEAVDPWGEVGNLIR